MSRFRVLHISDFRYDGPVSESYNEVHLRPIDDDYQICLSFRIATRPASHPAGHRDYFGNWVHRFNVLGEHRSLRIEAESVVMVHEPAAPPADGPQLAQLDSRREEILDEHYELLAPTNYAPQPEGMEELVRACEQQSGGTAAGFARAAAQLIHERFRYEKGATHVHSSAADVLSTGAGVCQDFAHLLLAIARRRGLPARYVSGYLVASHQGNDETGTRDISGGQASHAWAEVLIAGAGWFGFDPTQGRPVTRHHIRVAYGRDYGDVAPVRGVYRGHAGQRLSVDVRVRPALDEDGCEHVTETAGAPPPAPPVTAPQQQPQ
jgi:transglutaminase-like putative cysteine protease